MTDDYEHLDDEFDSRSKEPMRKSSAPVNSHHDALKKIECARNRWRKDREKNERT